MSAFWSMGGYAAFVWPAFAVSMGALIAVALWTVAAEWRLRRQLRALDRQHP